MIIHEQPFIALIENLIPESVLNDMRAQDNFIRSKGYRFGDGNNPSESIETEARTSSTAFTNNRYKDTTTLVLDYLSKTYGHEYDRQRTEQWQLTRYHKDQKYVPHHDFFNFPNRPIEQEGDRQATFILYLNDDFTGGTTNFPDLKIKVQPRAGAALYFRYPSDAPWSERELTRHAGAPVIEGVKTIATLWIR